MERQSLNVKKHPVTKCVLIKGAYHTVPHSL